MRNAELVAEAVDSEKRFEILKEMANRQKAALAKVDPIKALKKLDEQTYLDSGE